MCLIRQNFEKNIDFLTLIPQCTNSPMNGTRIKTLFPIMNMMTVKAKPRDTS